MSAFDLERAKAGEPVELADGTGAYVPVKYVGQYKDYQCVDHPDYPSVQQVLSASLRMAPKKVTVRYRVALFQNSGRLFTASADTEEEAGALSRRLNFLQWMAEWQAAEIPQPDLTDKEAR